MVIEEGAHPPSHPITNQHTAAPAIYFKANLGDRFLRKKIPPVGCSVDTQPPSPRLVKVDEAICKCPSRAKKGTTHACLLRACRCSTLTHPGEGWPETNSMDHWWYLLSQKPEAKIGAFLEAKIRASLLSYSSSKTLRLHQTLCLDQILASAMA